MFKIRIMVIQQIIFHKAKSRCEGCAVTFIFYQKEVIESYPPKNQGKKIACRRMNYNLPYQFTEGLYVCFALNALK